ncbi:MAG TPA: alkaline phosphatase family protein [Acidobacteriaceae bacterium]|nr:alkaline phosphatase family protein [Acidobacteriaceae bacterium]
MRQRKPLLTVAVCFVAGLLAASAFAQPKPKHNVIIFVADGLRRGSVNAQDTPALMKVRTSGVDFENSHSVFPTFTTANASAIATGHGLGDTGDYSNTLYPGVWLAKPDPSAVSGTITPFLESDDVLANMNAVFKGNYLGERTLLTAAHQAGFNVASIGKLGPTAIQQNDRIAWDQTGFLNSDGATIIDDSTGHAGGFVLSEEMMDALHDAGLPQEAPTRSNGFAEGSQWNNGFAGDAQTSGTLDANRIQQQWFADVTTKVLLPKFASESKPFVLLFWSRDPDGSQHNQGDSLQNLKPGINGQTSERGVRNADHCLQQLLAWLDAHPAVKASTDVLVTSDHGFATISRREIAVDGTQTAEVSALMTYGLSGKAKPEPEGTLPPGFLAVDLAIREHMRLFDPAVRATGGASAYAEVTLGGDQSQYPSTGSALLGETVKQVDGSDAKLIVAANGGSDLIYIPSQSAELVRSTLDVLAQLDYVGGIFVDDKFCASPSACPGALPMSAIGLEGASSVPRPAIVVSFKDFHQTAGDLQSAAQVADTTLQEGQGNHGGFGREETWNNMAAMGPDFKSGFVDGSPMGNIDIAPTLAHILGIEMPSAGTLKGRVVTEALAGGTRPESSAQKSLLSAPGAGGVRTMLEYQEQNGVRYLDDACLVGKEAPRHCP